MSDVAVTTEPRCSMISSIWTLYRLGLRQGLAGKKKYAAGLIALLPVGIALFWVCVMPEAARTPEATVNIFWKCASNAGLQLALILVSLIMACSSFSDEVDSRTIFYLFSKPMPKWWVVIGKFMSSTTITFAVVAVSILLTFGAIAVEMPSEARSECLKALAGFLVVALAGSASYCAMFTFIGAELRHPFLASFTIAFFWELIAANMPIHVDSVTIANNLRGILWEHFRTPLVRGDVFYDGYDWEPLKAATSLIRLGVFTAVCLALGCVAAMFKSYEGKEPTH
jgi:ABC-2 type transport system permease protein